MIKLGIALGAGGARGLAHIGVLKVLEREAIPIYGIVGSSAGAVVAASYAQIPDISSLIGRFKRALNNGFADQLGIQYLRSDVQEASALSQMIKRIKRRIIVNLAPTQKAILRDINLRDILKSLIDEGNIKNTNIKLGIVVTDLNTGADILFEKGNIIAAAAISASIPGFLPPTNIAGTLLTDGGVSCPVPVQFLHDMGATVTIGVETGIRKLKDIQDPNILNIIDRTTTIMSHRLGEMMVNIADVVICPDTGSTHWSEFDKFDELVKAGEEAAEEKLQDIKEAMKPKWKQRFLSKIRKR